MDATIACMKQLEYPLIIYHISSNKHSRHLLGFETVRHGPN